MALIERLRHLRVVFKDDGAIRSVTGEYDEIDTETGRAAPKGTKRIAAADLAGALPDAAAMLAAVDAAHAERDSLAAQLAAIQPKATVDGVPQSVTPYQARVALSRAGLLNSVEAAVSQANGEMAIAWEYATTIERNSPFIVQLGTAIGLTSQQIDDLFVTAASVS